MVARAQLTFQRLTLLQNIYTARASVQKHGTASVWHWELNRLEHSAWIRRLGVRVPLRSRHFLSQKLWHFRVSKMNVVARTQLTFQNVNFTSKIRVSMSAVPRQAFTRTDGEWMWVVPLGTNYIFPKWEQLSSRCVYVVVICNIQLNVFLFSQQVVYWETGSRQHQYKNWQEAFVQLGWTRYISLPTNDPENPDVKLWVISNRCAN